MAVASWEYTRSYRARSWIEKATEVQGSPDLQFVCHWIAFNALYGQDRNIGAQTEQVEQFELSDFLGKVVRLDLALVRGTLAGLHSQAKRLAKLEFLYREYWKDVPTDIGGMISREVNAIDAAWRVKQPERRLASLFQRIYLLRNQVFHGAAKHGSRKNRDSIAPALAVLTELVPVFADVVRGHPDDSIWGRLPYVPEGLAGHPSKTPFNPGKVAGGRASWTHRQVIAPANGRKRQ
jgi:hypothetical protein